MDVLLSHGYFLQDDPVEQEVMKPYPPLGLLYLSSFLKGRGFSIDVFDSTFASPAEFEARVRDARPPIVGLSANLMTRARIVAMIRVCRSLGSWIVVGGPEPANYPDRYLAGPTWSRMGRERRPSRSSCDTGWRGGPEG